MSASLSATEINCVVGQHSSFFTRLLERDDPTMALLLFDGKGGPLGTRQGSTDHFLFTDPRRGMYGSERCTVRRKGVQHVEQRPATRIAIQGTRPHHFLPRPRGVDFRRVLRQRSRPAEPLFAAALRHGAAAAQPQNSSSHFHKIDRRQPSRPDRRMLRECSRSVAPPTATVLLPGVHSNAYRSAWQSSLHPPPTGQACSGPP